MACLLNAYPVHHFSTKASPTPHFFPMDFSLVFSTLLALSYHRTFDLWFHFPSKHSAPYLIHSSCICEMLTQAFPSQASLLWPSWRIHIPLLCSQSNICHSCCHFAMSLWDYLLNIYLLFYTASSLFTIVFVVCPEPGILQLLKKYLFNKWMGEKRHCSDSEAAWAPKPLPRVTKKFIRITWARVWRYYQKKWLHLNRKFYG